MRQATELKHICPSLRQHVDSPHGREDELDRLQRQPRVAIDAEAGRWEAVLFGRQRHGC